MAEISRTQQKLVLQKINVEEHKRYLKQAIEEHKIVMVATLASTVLAFWKLNPVSYISRLLAIPLNAVLLLKKISLI